jgi:LysR family transcriptional regulator for metE and metH
MKHLTVLVALAETGGVTAAARRLGLTQSAVSHRLREAERRVGVALVQRTDGRVAFTAEGARLRAFADRMVDELIRIERDFGAAGADGQTLVRLGQATYSRYHWLPAFLDHLAGVEPGLSVDLSARATTRPFTALLEGAADVSTVYGRPRDTPRFRWLRLGSDPLVAAVAPGHGLSNAPFIDSRAMQDDRLFTYPLSGEPGFEWEALIGAPEAPFRHVTPMPTPEAVIDLVRAGMGVGVFSRWAIWPELTDGTLVARDLGAEPVSLDWWAVLRETDAADSPAARLARVLADWGAARSAPLATLSFAGHSSDSGGDE